MPAREDRRGVVTSPRSAAVDLLLLGVRGCVDQDADVVRRALRDEARRLLSCRGPAGSAISGSRPSCWPSCSPVRHAAAEALRTTSRPRRDRCGPLRRPARGPVTRGPPVRCPGFRRRHRSMWGPSSSRTGSQALPAWRACGTCAPSLPDPVAVGSYVTAVAARPRGPRQPRSRPVRCGRDGAPPLPPRPRRPCALARPAGGHSDRPRARRPPAKELISHDRNVQHAPRPGNHRSRPRSNRSWPPPRRRRRLSPPAGRTSAPPGSSPLPTPSTLPPTSWCRSRRRRPISPPTPRLTGELAAHLLPAAPLR